MKKQAGFTYLEVLVGLTIIVGLIALVYRFQDQITATQMSLLKQQISSQKVNSILTQMAREIRNSQFGENENYPLVTAQSSELVFYSDLDFDQKVERVHYWVEGTSLFKGVIEPDENNQYLADEETSRELTSQLNISQLPIFSYYNQNWPVDTENNPLVVPFDLTEVKLVEISLNISDYYLSTFAQIRRLKEENE